MGNIKAEVEQRGKGKMQVILTKESGDEGDRGDGKSGDK